MNHTADHDSAIAEHLRDHLTDGVWHDRCGFCLNRRRNGGTGVPAETGEAEA